MPPRLQEVAKALLLEGAEPVVAHRLGVTPGTLKAYSSKLYALLGVSGRVQMMARQIAVLQSRVHELEALLKADDDGMPRAA